MERKYLKVFMLFSVLLLASVVVNAYLWLSLRSVSTESNAPYRHVFEWLDLKAELNFTENNENLTVTVKVVGKGNYSIPSKIWLGMAFDMDGDGDINAGVTVWAYGKYLGNGTVISLKDEPVCDPDLVLLTSTENWTETGAFFMYYDDGDMGIGFLSMGPYKSQRMYCVSGDNQFIFYLNVPKPKSDIAYLQFGRFRTPLFHYKKGMVMASKPPHGTAQKLA